MHDIADVGKGHGGGYDASRRIGSAVVFETHCVNADRVSIPYIYTPDKKVGLNSPSTLKESWSVPMTLIGVDASTWIVVVTALSC